MARNSFVAEVTFKLCTYLKCLKIGLTFAVSKENMSWKWDLVQAKKTWPCWVSVMPLELYWIHWLCLRGRTCKVLGMETKHCQILGMEDQKTVGYGCLLLQTSLGISYIFLVGNIGITKWFIQKKWYISRIPIGHSHILVLAFLKVLKFWICCIKRSSYLYVDNDIF